MFWDLTPKEFEKYVKVYKEKRTERIKELDYLNYCLGKYIGFAVNDPKKYPRKPFLDKVNSKGKEKKKMTADEMVKMARRNTISLGGKIDGTKH